MPMEIHRRRQDLQYMGSSTTMRLSERIELNHSREILTLRLELAQNIETQLRLLEIPNEFKVDVVTPFLEEKTSKWWETVSPAMTAVGPVTWQQFREAFLKQYYSAEVRL